MHDLSKGWQVPSGMFLRLHVKQLPVHDLISLSVRLILVLLMNFMSAAQRVSKDWLYCLSP